MRNLRFKTSELSGGELVQAFGRIEVGRNRDPRAGDGREVVYEVRDVPEMVIAEDCMALLDATVIVADGYSFPFAALQAGKVVHLSPSESRAKRASRRRSSSSSTSHRRTPVQNRTTAFDKYK